MLQVHVDTVQYLNRVIPYHFNQSLDMTLSDLDEIWYTCSVCGRKKPCIFKESYGFPKPLKFFLFFLDLGVHFGYYSMEDYRREEAVLQQ